MVKSGGALQNSSSLLRARNWLVLGRELAEWWLSAAATRGCTARFLHQGDLCLRDSFSGCSCCLQGIPERKGVSVRTTELEEKTFRIEILLPELSWHSCASKANVENSWPVVFGVLWQALSSAKEKGSTFLLLLEIKGAVSVSGIKVCSVRHEQNTNWTFLHKCLLPQLENSYVQDSS